MDVQVCPGCGGRNGAQSESCDWCGRSFSERPRSFGIRWWQVVTSVLFGLTVVAVVGLAILNASRPDSRPVPAVAGGTPPAQSGPAATGVAATAQRPSPQASPAAAAPRPPTATPIPPPPAAEPTPTPRYVRVFNTGGLGVNIRKDPGPQGQALVAVPDSTVLRLLGPEETVQARLWRLCEHEARGIQGWVPADFLQQSDVPPTPARS